MSQAFQKLIGEKVLTPKGKGQVEVESLIGEDKVIGLYFSAHWCPPCRGFTPKLADFYKKFRDANGEKLEIVFISSDRDENQFQKYFDEMPWHALPFNDRDKKKKLSKKYKVGGIPTLVFLDGKDASLITKNGRLAMMEDPKGENFPWKPKSVFELIQGKFVNGKGEEITTDNLKGKVVGLYFSAHWCPPCRAFTPLLGKTYNAIKAAEKEFEVIFLSSDRSEESFNGYLATMPWYAVPYSDSSRKNAISKHFGVEGIPTLIIMDENWKVISINGRGAVAADPEGKEFPWKPKPLSELNDLTASILNEEACAVYFTDGDEGTLKHAKEILQPLADSYMTQAEQANEDLPIHFFYGGNNEVVDSVLDFAGLSEENMLAILDIPSGKVYVCEKDVVTAEAAKQFIDDFLSDKLEGRKIR
ncbi:nucleoredoxin [Exaiptasia diaphana]|uniref:Nucleoredoxin n=1 Tax=Exaiptasia diaphana TaxID=2652724 RepID=A0A913XTS7_EXADI|nr:nucleoredoxin [Exaiptasia diaphana]KXJ29402.1 Nucleoredoxin [Exaiptasia diaphana]